MRTMNPDEVSVIVGGVPVTDFADGTYVTCGRNEDAVMLRVGSKGEASRSISQNRSGFFEFTLKATSPLNGVFAGYAALDELGGNGVVPVVVRDNRDGSTFTGTKSWVQKTADTEFSDEVTDRVWRFETGTYVAAHVGGHS